MGYLDSTVDKYFVLSENGNTIFYPNGVFGSGYIITEDEKKQSLRKRLKIKYCISTAIILMATWYLFGVFEIHKQAFWTATIVFVVYLLLLILLDQSQVMFLVKELQRSNTRLTFREQIENTAKTQSIEFLWFGEIFSIILFVLSVIAIFSNLFGGLMGISISVCFGVMCGYMIKRKPHL